MLNYYNIMIILLIFFNNIKYYDIIIHNTFLKEFFSSLKFNQKIILKSKSNNSDNSINI